MGYWTPGPNATSGNDEFFGTDPFGENVDGLGGNDLLQGYVGSDTLEGGNGADILDGGLGADTLWGGANADAYVFSTTLGGGNVDTIIGFSTVDDIFLLSGAVFTGLSFGALNANNFRIGTEALDADDRIIYDPVTGNIYFDADGNSGGDEAPILFATVTPGLALTASDFVVGP